MFGYLEGNMKVERPIIFLCGPYYNKNDKGDRRNVLLGFLEDNLVKGSINLIIDDFVIFKNIKDDSISIKLLEEIFASISAKTYIFLDTMSAASELGLFASDASSNKIHVLLPYTSDIIEDKIGYFITDVILGQNGEYIECEYYRPKIIKKAIATGFIKEHYGFINDEIPKEIEKKILKDSQLDSINKQINISNETEVPQEFAKFNFSIQNINLNVAMSIKTLFYMVVAFMYNKYKRQDLAEKNINKMEDFFIDEVYINLRKTLALSLSVERLHELYDYSNVNIITNSKQNTRMIIKHMLKFIVLYHENHPRGGKMFITQKDRIVSILERELKANPYELFDLDEHSVELLYSIGKCNNFYFEEFEIKQYGKKRVLCRYKEDDNGEMAKKLHDKLSSVIKSHIFLSGNSYAYQERKSIVQCVNCHINSISFIKLDIKRYFNSIDIKLLVDVLTENLDIDNIFKEHMKTIVKACTYNNKLPLGFTISPMLTEIYMKSFDESVVGLANKKGYIYTRYADDIMISSDKVIKDEEKDCIVKNIEKLLHEKKLKLNKTKSKLINLSKNAHHVKYIGINIVKGEGGNFLSVGKRYRNSIAKEYLKWLELPTATEEQETTRFYKSRTIEGKISFVKQVEGNEGFYKITERIRASTEGRVDIKEDKINFS